ncbi:hypothetical protein [Paractinoplanes abujensis]|uniref:Uncharacterized protein n=1 Tax=Paractinoplanes abujensis TaxID=882441 RepID=A0A7W7G641_9ACTN|nr:hypothetical protein [Actinoplanes abujensis]MBB4697194.1 hypothetical protein [Actinoplanes abujensis]
MADVLPLHTDPPFGPDDPGSIYLGTVNVGGMSEAGYDRSGPDNPADEVDPSTEWPAVSCTEEAWSDSWFPAGRAFASYSLQDRELDAFISLRQLTVANGRKLRDVFRTAKDECPWTQEAAACGEEVGPITLRRVPSDAWSDSTLIYSVEDEGTSRCRHLIVYMLSGPFIMILTVWPDDPYYADGDGFQKTLESTARAAQAAGRRADEKIGTTFVRR